MAVNLYARRGGEGPPILLLHGLFGSGSNLGALSRALQGRLEVYSLDLPNHGRSGWLVAPDLASMASCIYQWMDQQGLPGAHLMGHSLGAKVAMQMALQYPGRVRSLVVADIAPVAYAASHDAVFSALQAVAAAKCATREEAALILGEHLHEEGVIQLLLMSLHKVPGGYFGWRFDLEGIRASYPALLAAPVTGRTFNGPVLFIKGGASNYIQDQYWPVISELFPAATIKVLPDCGHWLHVEKPELFNGLVKRFLALA